MIITLVKADFSVHNIGTLDGFAILTNLSNGLSYNGPKNIIKNQPLITSITIEEEYILQDIVITMGGTVLEDAYTIDNNNISINIANVTGMVIITANVVGDITPPEPTLSWYINALDQIEASGKDITKGTDMTTAGKYAPWSFDETMNAKLVGQTVNTIEIVPFTAGVFNVGKYNVSTGRYTHKDSFTVLPEEVGIKTRYSFKDYVIAEDEFFTFNENGDAAHASYYLANALDTTQVETCEYLWSNVDETRSKFNYKMIVIMNVGFYGVPGATEEEPSVPESTTTTWYIQSLQQLQDSGNNIDNNKVKLAANNSYAWAFNESLNDKLVGQTINTMEIYPSKVGTFHIGKFDTSTNTIVESRELTIDSIDTPVTCTFADMTINDGEFFIWNNTSDATNSESTGYYILKSKVDQLAVETSSWYQVKSSGLVVFASGTNAPHELVFVANIGYTPNN